MDMQHIAFLGAGSMAEALISGMLREDVISSNRIIATNRSNQERLDNLKRNFSIQITQNKEELMKSGTIIFLAMKPKDVLEGLNGIKKFVRKDHLFISLLAGVSSQTIMNILEQEVPIVRAMPNTSAFIGKSSTALATGEFANTHHLEVASMLLQTVGTITTVTEEQLHAVTGLSGSGPAYIYYVVESMLEASHDLGLDTNIAMELIIQTVVGAAGMLQQTKLNPALLRKKVTSEGGTTEAGIKTLEQYHYKQAMIDCIKQATKRSIEMEERYAVQRN